MIKKVLIFFPHNPWPPRSGAHRRCLEMLWAWRELGCEVTLASSAASSETAWTAESRHELARDLVREVRVHTPSRFERLGQDVRRHWHAWRRAIAPPGDAVYSPPGMRRWFDRVCNECEPDAIVMNYALWDALIDHTARSQTTRIIDVLDFVTLNLRMQRALAPLQDPADPPEEMLREDFFDRLGLDVDPREYEIFDRYDHTISITAHDSEKIDRHVRRTRVTTAPVTLEPHYIGNRYAGPALLAMGPNLFNLQGLYYFSKMVLPAVRAQAAQFQLRVTGFTPGQSLRPEPNVELAGFVPDLTPHYQEARFAINPVLGGTGQQIKIVEAMAHGLPVIATQFAADRSPIEHDVNGLVARDAGEFAQHVVDLWNDPARCRRLGAAARELVAVAFSRPRLLETMAGLLQPPQRASKGGGPAPLIPEGARR